MNYAMIPREEFNQLQADLAAKDAEIETIKWQRGEALEELEHLEQGFLKLTCVTRAWDTQADQDDQPCEFDCHHTRQGTDYCQAVIDTVKGDENA